ncbi:MAG TPA: MerC domain-containing protein, partial [Sphingomonas sp.]|nr:MerC domain-containing protein [Sphingomonas sp.]
MNRSRVDLVERAAVAASVACLFHCLALPLLLAALPALSRVFAIPESFHRWILAFAIPTSALAFWTGRASHGAYLPSVFGVAGLAGMASGVFLAGGTAAETVLTVAGSISLAVAH